MEIKQFFQWDRTKGVALVLLILIILFLGLIALALGSQTCDFGPCSQGTLVRISGYFVLFIGWPFLLMLGIEKLIFKRVDWIHSQDIPFIIVALAITLFWIYFLACLLSWVYKKFKKNKGDESQ